MIPEEDPNSLSRNSIDFFFDFAQRVLNIRAIFLSNSLPRGKKLWSNSRGWGKIFPNSKKLLFKLAKNP